MESRYRTAATLSGLRALPDNRFLGRLRTLRWRRALVVAVAAGWLLTVVTWLARGLTAPAAVWLAPAVPTAIAWTLLVLATRNVANAVDAFVDERDRAVRDRAHRIAYWVLGLVLGAAMGAAASIVQRTLAAGSTLVLDRTGVPVAATIAFTLALVYATLPVAILAWTEPDPPDHPDFP